MKRDLSTRADSEDRSTSTCSTNSTPFASLLPPLNKKRKLMDSTSHSMNRNSTYAPAPIHPLHSFGAPQLISINPIASASHHISIPSTNLSLDMILSTLSGLNSINNTQLNALKTLILAANDDNPMMTTQSDTAQTSRTVPIAAVQPRRVMNDPLSNVSLSTEDIKRASCHQCKTKKDVNVLFYCTKTRQRKVACSASDSAANRKRCRKKYCETCMAKYYTHEDVAQLRSVKHANGWCWQCPACIDMCTCRACKRKKVHQQQEEKTIGLHLLYHTQ
eukprot:74592_1